MKNQSLTHLRTQMHHHATKALEFRKQSLQLEQEVAEKEQTKAEWLLTVATSWWSPGCVFNLLMAVIEYLVSIRIWQVFLPAAPWLGALGMIAMGAWIAHGLGKFLSGELREWARKETLRAHSEQEYGLDELEAKCKREASKEALLALVFLVGGSLFVYYLTAQRIQWEVAAGLRQNPAWIILDWAPLGIFVLNAFIGIYWQFAVCYLHLKWFLIPALRTRRETLWRRYNHHSVRYMKYSASWQEHPQRDTFPGTAATAQMERLLRECTPATPSALLEAEEKAALQTTLLLLEGGVPLVHELVLFTLSNGSSNLGISTDKGLLIVPLPVLVVLTKIELLNRPAVNPVTGTWQAHTTHCIEFTQKPAPSIM